MANTTWNPSDKGATIALSGGNLIATCSSNGLNGVRAIDKQVTGKFYWECTGTTFTGTTAAVGMAVQGANLAGLSSGASVGTTSLTHLGAVYVDGSTVGQPSFGTIASGTVICIAFDAGARLIWYRLGAAGNWNTFATANPATGAGGVLTPSLGVGIPAYPACCLAAVNDQITANFGGSAFTGTVPSGFTSGFTAGASIPTNALASQISAEHWLTTSPQAQVTQIAAEHWATVTGTGLQAVVTQIAAEHWASVASIVPSRGGPIITMIG